MKAMARSHPLTRVLGAIVIVSAIATRRRLTAMVHLLDRAEGWARVLHHDLHDIARDAETGRMAVRELLGDGEASEADQRQLDLIFDRIATRALTGSATE
jgi:hypothetical protein